MKRNIFENVNLYPKKFKGDVIVFKEYRAIYFAVPKAANSSFKSLSTDLLKEEIPAEYLQINRKTLPFMDKNCRQILKNKRILIEKFNRQERKYWKFTVVRNPWNRLLSCYSQKIKMIDSAGLPLTNDRFLEGVSRSFIRRYGNTFNKYMDYSDFVDTVCSIPDSEADKHFASQSSFVCDHQGDLIVDHVGKVENLITEFQYIKKKCSLSNKISLPHKNQSKASRIDILNHESDRIKVKKRYATDYDLFGY